MANPTLNDSSPLPKMREKGVGEEFAVGHTKPNLLGLNRATLEKFFIDLGEKPFRATQILKWIHQFGVADFQAMTNLGKGLRATLEQSATIRALDIIREERSQDGTQKWLLALDHRNSIEMVYIPEPDRGTLCISSQAGCALGCTFCSTAQQGFNRNLNAGEIIAQMWLAHRLLAPRRNHPDRRPITNVVLMGMGEPLLNFDAVVVALDILLEDFAYGLAKKRVTLSTSGIVPGILNLAERAPVSLAVSLHAPNNRLRDQLVPINRKYPIETLLTACRYYANKQPKQKVTFEYVMLNGINDSPECAKELASQLGDLPAKVNLIPFNPFPNSTFTRSTWSAIDKFRDILMAKGINTITRRPRGDDINAACGQLVGLIAARGKRAHEERTDGQRIRPDPALSGPVISSFQHQPEDFSAESDYAMSS